MPREQFQTLTEPMYYVLLALTRECRGIDVMAEVARLSRDRVAVGPGTVYAMLDKFLEHKLIAETGSQGRSRTYIITDKGLTMLRGEFRRLQTMAADGQTILGGSL